jgi:hypothetical protein
LDLPETVAERICSLTPHYRIDQDRETGGAFWMNHCEHRGVQMMEEESHGKSDGPFGSVPDEDLEPIRWYEVLSRLIRSQVLCARDADIRCSSLLERPT